MPTYNFRNKETGEEYSLFLSSFKAKEDYLEQNPLVESFVAVAPALHSGMGLGVRKVDNGFKDLLNNMKRNNKGSTINTNL